MTTTTIFPLRLPRSIKADVEKVSKQDGTSINQFVAIAVAEKLAVLEADRFFGERRKNANLKKFDATMKRKGGQPLRAGDEPR